MLRLGANFASVGSCLAGSAEWLIWDFSLFRNSCLVHPVRVNRESKKKTWPVKPKQTPKWGRATVSDIDSLRVPHFEQHLPRDTRYFLQKHKYWQHTENLSPVFGFKTQIRSFFFLSHQLNSLMLHANVTFHPQIHQNTDVWRLESVLMA